MSVCGYVHMSGGTKEARERSRSLVVTVTKGSKWPSPRNSSAL